MVFTNSIDLNTACYTVIQCTFDWTPRIRQYSLLRNKLLRLNLIIISQWNDFRLYFTQIYTLWWRCSVTLCRCTLILDVLATIFCSWRWVSMLYIKCDWYWTGLNSVGLVRTKRYSERNNLIINSVNSILYQLFR